MEDTDSGTQRARVLRVATRCTTSDQFVEAFARFCEGRTLFVSSLSTRPIGTRLPFVILLADGTRAMRGQCEVIESYANPGNIYRRPGVKLSLVELDDDSESMLTRLQEARAIRDARATGVHQAVSAAAVELPSQSRAAIAPKAATPSHGVGVLPALTRSMPPRPPGSKLPALPPLPRAQAHPPEPPPRAPSEPPPRAPSEPPPRAPAAEPAGGHWLAPQPPSILQPVHDRARRAPTHDPTDDGWGDDEARPPRAPTAPPVPRPRTEPPPPAIEEDSSPAMIVAAAPDHAAAAAAASTEPVDSLPVVELINRAHPRRDSGRVARPSPSPTPAPASGRTTGRHGSVSGTRPTPGDVYSPEERTPGSSFILPANPLSNLSDESLQGFIELTIYEDHTQPAPVASDPAISGSTLGMVDEEPEPDFRPYAPPPSEPVVMPVSLTQSARARSISMAASGELHVPAIDDRSPGGGVVVELVKPRVSQRLASVDEDEDEDEGLPPAVTPAPARHPTAPPLHVGHPTPAPVAGSERARRPTPPPPLPVAGSERARRPTPPPPPPAAPARARTLTPPPPLPPPPREVRPGTSRPDWMAPPATDPKARPVRKGTVRPPVAPPRRGWVLPVLLGGLVLVAAAALYVRYGDRLRKHGAATAPPHDAAVAALHVDAGVVAPAPIDAGATMVAAVDAGVDASTAVASGVCHLRVSTTPTGAAVAVGRRTLGDAPAAADFACGEVTVTARMAKYQTGTKTVTLAPGDDNVRIKLSRPMHAITVLSTPRGAVVTLDGRRVGTTPLSLDVTGFSRHALTIEYPAYQPYRTSVQTDEPEQTIAVPLVKQ